MRTPYFLNASRLPRLPHSFSTPLSSFGSLDTSIVVLSRRPTALPLSFIKADFVGKSTTVSTSSLQSLTLPISRSSLRSIRQAQTEGSLFSQRVRRFSSTPFPRTPLPSISYFTSFPTPVVSRSVTKALRTPFYVSSGFFPIHRVSFYRAATYRFFVRRQRNKNVARRLYASPLLLASEQANLLSFESQSVNSLDSVRYSNTWDTGLARVTHQSVADTLSLLIGSPVHLTRVSALSVARFAHDRETLLSSATQRASRVGSVPNSPVKLLPQFSFSTSSFSQANTSFSFNGDSSSALADFLSNRHRFAFRVETSRPFSQSAPSVVPVVVSNFFNSISSNALPDVRSSRRQNASVLALPRLTSAALLRTLERSRGRFQRTAVHLPDLLRLGFVARYFKKADLLASLFS